MSRLDPVAIDTIQRFGAGMGLVPQPAEDGSFGFLFQHSGRLTLQGDESGDHLILSLTRPVLASDVVPLAQLAALGGADPITGQFYQTGINRSGQPVVIVALPARGLDLSQLERAFGGLRSYCETNGL